ncbi:hypothetical protein IAQ61_000605 [Plenodomus lingam]|uniref:uncharacterized protein n=1 Tax=Leptosphaeria maculans TaxID=5022 RepID=UPI00332667C3|nr:hypothetical protein IAQ61_000605 [Plenodomus lingam]
MMEPQGLVNQSESDCVLIAISGKFHLANPGKAVPYPIPIKVGSMTYWQTQAVNLSLVTIAIKVTNNPEQTWIDFATCITCPEPSYGEVCPIARVHLQRYKVVRGGWFGVPMF